MKKMVLLIALAISFTTLYGQKQPPPLDEFQMQERMDKLENFRIWKMTETLDLSEKQAEKFFPKLREGEKKLQKLYTKRQELHSSIQEMIDSEKIILDEVLKITESIKKLDHKIVDARSNLATDMGCQLDGKDGDADSVGCISFILDDNFPQTPDACRR